MVNNYVTGAPYVYSLQMTYLDQNYTTSSTGHVANSYQNGYITLWGADGYDTTQGIYADPRLGSDIVMQVPEPASLLLMSMGMIGIGFWRRNKQNNGF